MALVYAPRRIDCPTCGVKVERMPWCTPASKSPMTLALTVFLARWARRLSWKQVAEVFGGSWDRVYRAVESVVNYGLAHCQATIILRRQRQLESVMTMMLFPSACAAPVERSETAAAHAGEPERPAPCLTSTPGAAAHGWAPRPWTSWLAPPGSSAGSVPGLRCDAPGGRWPPPWSWHP